MRWPSGVTKIRQRPVVGAPVRAATSKRMPAAWMSCANTSPSWSSATWPMKAQRLPSAAMPAIVFAADPPDTSCPGPIFA